jgi:hypothetical protein
VLVPLLVVIAFVVQERRNVRKLREQEKQDGDDEASGDRGPADS